MALFYDENNATTKPVTQTDFQLDNLPLTEKINEIGNLFLEGNYSVALKMLKNLIAVYNSEKQIESFERVFLLPSGGAVEVYLTEDKLIIQERTPKEQEYYDAQISRFNKLINGEITKLDVLKYYLPLAHRYFAKQGYIISSIVEKHVYSTIAINKKVEKEFNAENNLVVGNFKVIKNDNIEESNNNQKINIEKQTAEKEEKLHETMFDNDNIVNSIFEDDTINYHASYDLDTLVLEKENINLNEHKHLKVIENDVNNVAELLKSNKVVYKQPENVKAEIINFSTIKQSGKTLLNFYDTIRTYDLDDKTDFVVAKSNVFWKLQLLAVNKHINLMSLLTEETMKEFEQLALIMKLFEIASFDISRQTQIENKQTGKLYFNQIARLKLVNCNDGNLLPAVKEILLGLLTKNINLSTTDSYNLTVERFLLREDVKEALLKGLATIEDLILVELYNGDSEIKDLYNKMLDNSYLNVFEIIKNNNELS